MANDVAIGAKSLDGLVDVNSASVNVGALFTLPANVLASLPAVTGDKGVTSKGVVLDSSRNTVTLMVDRGDGVQVPSEFSLSLYITRQPVNDDERQRVNDYAAKQTKNKADKLTAENERLAREKRAMFELGQTGMVDAMRILEERQAREQRAAAIIAAASK